MTKRLKYLLIIYCLSTLMVSCGNTNEAGLADSILDRISTQPYRMIGDISADETIDDPNFIICGGENNIAQYFHFGKGLEIEGEQIAIKRAFDASYKPVESTQSGMIRIRFIVNCEGKTGRFRISQADEEYQEITFDPEITEQLLDITKGLDGWAIQEADYGQTNYYQYLVFKIQNGTIKEILP